MIVPPAIIEIFVTCHVLLLVSSIFVSVFKARPSVALPLSRFFFLACLLCPIAVQFVEPPRPLLGSAPGWIETEEDGSAVLETGLPESVPREIEFPSLPQLSAIENLQVYLFALWLVGLLWHGVSFVRDMRKVHAILEGAWHFRSLGNLQIKLSDQCRIPFSVRGARGAYIVLPTSMLTDREKLKIALAHEGQHHRQGDCAFAYCFEMVALIFFCNPGMWRWRTVFRNLQEFACDEALVCHMALSPYVYGRCLFEVAQAALQRSERHYQQLPCSAGMAWGSCAKARSLLTRRITMLPEYRSSTPLHMMARLTLVGVTLALPLSAAYAARGSLAHGSSDEVDTSALDPRIQGIAAEEISGAVEHYGAKSGAIVVADATTGRILAFAEKRSDGAAESWATRTFVPGSTIKPFIAAAAIELGVATEKKLYDCRQPYTVGGRDFVNNQNLTSTLSLTDAIAHSANTCVIRMAEDIGVKELKAALDRFGFETREEPSHNSNDRLRLAQLTLGEALPVTMQTMITAYSILANDGRSADRASVVSASTAHSVRRMLRAVVTLGTGKNAALSGIDVVGKTGTVMQGSGSLETDANPFLGLFAGYVPYGKTQLVTFVVIEADNTMKGSREKSSGGTLAAPVFHEVMRRSLETLKLPWRM